MTKKNLSDLLKEEANAPEAASAETAESTSAPAKPSTAQKTASQSTSSRSSSGRRGPTKADLEQQVTQLQADLQAAQEREAALNQQVEGLQADLEKQQARIFELKDTVEQAQRSAKADTDKLTTVTQELADAKQVILKMTATADTAAGTPENAIAPAAKPIEKPAAPPVEKPAVAQPAAEKPALSVKMRHGGDIYRGGRRLPAYKNVPDYAIDHGEQKNRMLSDEEIGWVD